MEIKIKIREQQFNVNVEHPRTWQEACQRYGLKVCFDLFLKGWRAAAYTRLNWLLSGGECSNPPDQQKAEQMMKDWNPGEFRAERKKLKKFVQELQKLPDDSFRELMGMLKGEQHGSRRIHQA